MTRRSRDLVFEYTNKEYIHEKDFSLIIPQENNYVLFVGPCEYVCVKGSCLVFLFDKLIQITFVKGRVLKNFSRSKGYLLSGPKYLFYNFIRRKGTSHNKTVSSTTDRKSDFSLSSRLVYRGSEVPVNKFKQKGILSPRSRKEY